MKNINLDLSASAQLIAAPTAPETIVVLGLDLNAAAAVKATFLSGGTSGTAKHTFNAVAGNLHDALPVSEEGWFACAPGENLYLNLVGSVNVTGSLRYAIKS